MLTKLRLWLTLYLSMTHLLLMHQIRISPFMLAVLRYFPHGDQLTMEIDCKGKVKLRYDNHLKISIVKCNY